MMRPWESLIQGEIVREVVEHRDRNSKHFQLATGEMQAIIGGAALHYQDDDGEWKDIDTAVEDLSEDQPLTVDGETYDLCVVKAPYRAYYKKNSSDPMRVEWPGIGHIVVRAMGTNATEAVTWGSDHVVYPNAWDGVDWVRRTLPERVKSDFIIGSIEAQSEFRFSLELSEGLEYKVLDDGTILWFKDDEEVGSFFAPIMLDARDIPGRASQWIEETPKGPQLVLAADRDWMESPSRTWPVSLDPTIQISPSVAESYISDRQRNANFGSESWLYCHYPDMDGDGFTEQRDALIQFNIPSSIIGANLSSAQLFLYQNNRWYAWRRGSSLNRAPTIGLALNQGPWSENAVTWNNAPPYSTIRNQGPTSTNTNLWVSIPASNVVREWVQNGVPNHGFRLITVLPDSEYTQGGGLIAKSKRHPDNQGPYLIVTYNHKAVASNLKPGGGTTPENPARINTTTPVLSWDYSDPDGQPQGAFSLLIVNDETLQTVHSKTEHTSLPQYTVPAGVLAAGQRYRWTLSVADIDLLMGDDAPFAYFYVNRAPSVQPTFPVGVSADPGAVANTEEPRFTWEFSDPDGDAQAKYKVTIYSSTNTLLHDTGWVTSADEFFDVPEDVLEFGNTYYWHVQVEDPYGLQSTPSTAQYFRVVESDNAPSNLSPGGATLEQRAIINTSNPTFTWTHNNPNAIPQGKFQVEVYNVETGVKVHDSGEVTSSDKSYELPDQAALNSSTFFRWRVRTQDNSSGEWGPYAEAYIYTNAAPQGAVSLSPSGNEVFDATQSKAFTWEFTDPDIESIDDGQTAFRIQIMRVSDGAIIVDTGAISSQTSSYTLLANTLVNGVAYHWRVQTTDKHGQVGQNSALATFITGTPPTVSITQPTNGGTYQSGILTAQWVYADAEGNPQAQYRVRLYAASGLLLEDSRLIQSNATSHTLLTILQNNEQYELEVTVADNTGQQGSSRITFTTSFIPPTKPIMGVMEDDAEGRIILTITNPDDDPLLPPTVRNDIYRREKKSGAPWIRIASSVAKNGSYTDYAAASGVEYEYRAMAVSQEETTAEGDIETGQISFPSVWLHDPEDAEGTRHLFEFDGRNKSNEIVPESSTYRFRGRRYPVAEFSSMTDQTLKIRLATPHETGDAAAIMELLERRRTLLYRDGRGRKMYCIIPRLPTTDELWGGWVDLELQRVDYDEAR